MFQKWTATDLDRHRALLFWEPYVEFLGQLEKGEGGRVRVAAAGVGRATVKRRIRGAARGLGMTVSFIRTGPSEVVFEVTRVDGRVRSATRARE